MTQNVQAESLSAEEKQEQIQRWQQEEHVKIQKYCHSQGIQAKSLDQKQCQCLPPAVAVWYINSVTKGEDYWIISGELPTDLAPAKVANNAREAMRYFAMNWQLKAANLEDALAEGKVQLADRETQQKFAQELTVKAEAVYKLATDEKLWASTGLKVS